MHVYLMCQNRLFMYQDQGFCNDCEAQYAATTADEMNKVAHELTRFNKLSFAF